MIKKYLNNLRETKFWYYFLKFSLVPIFNFVWIYVINLQGKILSIFYNKNYQKNNKNYFLVNNDKKILRNIPEFKMIIEEINYYLDDHFLNEMKKKITNEHFKEGHYLFRGKNFFIDMYPEIDDKLKKKIVDFALSDFNLSIVTNYLKVMPIIGKISLNLNIPVPNSKEGGSMLWHKDDFGYKSLDLFLPIKEVSENNGPFSYIEKKNHLGVFHKIKKIKKNALLGERNKIELDTFEKISNGNYKNFLSQIGDGIFIDSFTCYHKGGYCKEYDRLMLRISYQTPDSIDVVGKENKNGFRYYNHYKKSSFNFFDYKRYILFKRFRIFKIQNFLMSIYRLFHYKSDSLF